MYYLRIRQLNNGVAVLKGKRSTARYPRCILWDI